MLLLATKAGDCKNICLELLIRFCFPCLRVVKSFLPACVKRSKLVRFGNIVKNTTSATAATNSRLVATPIPGLNCCVLLKMENFYEQKNALAFL